LIYFLSPSFSSWYWLGRKYRSSRSLKNRRVLIFGPTLISLELIKELSSRQADIIVASSDPEICEEIVKNSFFESNVQVELVDFTRLHSIAEFCDSISRQNKPIDVFISSAEIQNHYPEVTEDSVEITFQTNYLSHYLAVIKLSQYFKRSRNGRIIFITSGSHNLVDRCPKKEFHLLYKDTPEYRQQAYQYSKFCLTSFAWKLADLMSAPNLSVHCVDPGKFSENPLHQLIFKTPSEAIQGILLAILSEKKPPFYIEGIRESFNYNRLVSNHLIANILWTLSRKLCEKSRLTSTSI
jgi:NAD(P)-dependent dehydrogenase (short-subunit alcohol dehydrogenase family)